MSLFSHFDPLEERTPQKKRRPPVPADTGRPAFRHGPTPGEAEAFDWQAAREKEPEVAHPGGAADRLRFDWQRGRHPALAQQTLTGPIGAHMANDRLDVAKLETALHDLGAFGLFRTAGPTGYFGGLTDEAIRDTQSALGVKVDGVVNPNGETWRAIRDALGRPRPGDRNQARPLGRADPHPNGMPRDASRLLPQTSGQSAPGQTTGAIGRRLMQHAQAGTQASQAVPASAQTPLPQSSPSQATSTADAIEKSLAMRLNLTGDAIDWTRDKVDQITQPIQEVAGFASDVLDGEFNASLSGFREFGERAITGDGMTPHELPSDNLWRSQAIQDARQKNTERTLDGMTNPGQRSDGSDNLTARILKLQDGQTLQDTDDWSAGFSASDHTNDDARYAVGNANVRTDTKVTVRRDGDTVHLEGTIDDQVHDTYDFAAGAKGPGAVGRWLQEQGLGEPYPSRSTTKHRRITATGRIVTDPNGSQRIEWDNVGFREPPGRSADRRSHVQRRREQRQ